MSRHVNIPIFISHLGCPNQCVFCNQRHISGVQDFCPGDVDKLIKEALATVNNDDEVEIAFFGGSFTGIDRDLMISLLETSYKYVEMGKVESIRCSTRPDYINEEIVGILKKYGVKTVELGLQSCSDNVLKASKRGHNFEAERDACEIIVDSGLNLVGQMMIGLPGSDIESEIESARFIINSGAVGARIYPTVVFRDTELYHMTLSGEYKALSIDEAVERSALVLELFINAGVRVIRIGLQASEGLSSKESYYAGPNHAALGELVENRLYYNKISKKLSDMHLSGDEKIDIFVARGALSKAVGQKKQNKIRLAEKYRNIRFFESENLAGYDISACIMDGESICI